MKNGILLLKWRINILFVFLLSFSLVIFCSKLFLKETSMNQSLSRAKTKARLRAMMRFKFMANEIFNKLKEASYFKKYEKKSSNTVTQINNNTIKTAKIDASKKKKRIFRLSSQKNTKISEVNEPDEQVYPQYRYKSYRLMVEEIYNLEKEYPKLIKVSIAQKRYDLPYPGGKCDNGKFQKE